jgi:hypothetical protein
MKKINICVSKEDAIANYNNIQLTELSMIANGSIDEIIFRTVDNIDASEKDSMIVTALKKLKEKGTLIIEFLDILSISKLILNGSLTSKSISGIFANKKSFSYEKEIIDTVKNFPQFNIRNRYKNKDNIVMNIHKELNK